MASPAHRLSISAQRRLEMLSSLPFLAQLPLERLTEIAGSAEEISYPRGAIIAQEGCEGDTMYVISAGWVQVIASTAGGSVLLGTLGRGEVFGEMCLVEPEGRRQATVSSLTELHLLAVPGEAIRRLFEDYSDVRTALETARDDILLANFLKKATPFTQLAPGQLRHMAGSVEHVTVEAGRDIVRQGERGDVCYVLKTGLAEVILDAGTSGEKALAVLGPGALVGESALLIDAPRSATVRAIHRCDLLMLRRTALLAVMRENRDTAVDVLNVVRQRRPPPEDSVVVQNDVADTIPPTRLHRRLHRVALDLIGQHMSLDQLLLDTAHEAREYPQLGEGNDLEDVRTHMARLVEYWESAGDRRCIFLRCYWHMTGSMVEALRANRFHDTTWVQELLERFADYYFRALLLQERGSASVPEAWKAAFQLTGSPWVTVGEHLLLGVNAHINRDLPFVVTEMLTDEWAGLDALQQRQRQEDYSAVNQIIAETTDAVMDDVIARYDALIGIISSVGRPVMQAASRNAGRFICAWRDEVWHLGVQLVEEPEAENRARIAEDIERRAANRVKPVISTAELRSYLSPGNARG